MDALFFFLRYFPFRQAGAKPMINLFEKKIKKNKKNRKQFYKFEQELVAVAFEAFFGHLVVEDFAADLVKYFGAIYQAFELRFSFDRFNMLEIRLGRFVAGFRAFAVHLQ